jgi:hypothetical protein
MQTFTCKIIQAELDDKDEKDKTNISRSLGRLC